jgi:autotransporter-associated beta strand protein
MKPKHHHRSFFPTLILAGSLAASLAQAADEIWSGSGADAEWSSVGNWVSGLTTPGAISGTTSPDIATFNSGVINTWGGTVGNPILITPNLNLSGINFGSEAGSYFIGSTSGSPLLLTSGGSIQIFNTLTTAGVTETVNAPLIIQGASGTYTLANNSSDSLSVLKIGGSVVGDAAGATVLTLTGTNTGINTLSGVIANGTATTLGITKTDVGNWNLTGANTHTGTTTVSAGTLTSNNLVSWKSNVAIASGATFNWNVTNSQKVLDTVGNYTFSGAGVLLLSGGFKLDYGNNIPVIQFNLSAGGQIDIQGAGTLVEFGYGHNTIGGNLGSLNVATGASFYSSDAVKSCDALTGAGRIGNAYNAPVTMEIGVSNTTNNAVYGVTANTAEFSGVISGPDSFNNVPNGPFNIKKSGTGTQIFSGANTYTGTTTVSGGVLQIGTGGTSGNLGTGNVILTSPGSLTLNRSDAYSYGGVISGTGSFTHSGTGTTTLAGTSTYTGTTTISAGTVKLKPAEAITSALVPGFVRRFDASTLTGTNGASIPIWPNGGIGRNATVPAGNTAPTLISNAGTGTGLSALQFNGGTGLTPAFDSQALNFSRLTDARTVFSVFKGSSFLMTDSDNFAFNRPSDNIPSDTLLTGNFGGDMALVIGGSTYINGALVDPRSFPMPTNLHNGYNLISVLTSGNISLNGFNKDRDNHAGNQSQAEVLIYNFLLTDAQRLEVENYLTIKWFGLGAIGGLLPTSSPVTIGAGATFDLNGVSQQLVSLAGPSGGSVTNSGVSNSILVLSGTSNTDFGGVISDGATNNMSVVKSGLSIQTLSGTNTYSGNTSVGAGTLKLTNANASNEASTVTVASTGATLELDFPGTDTVDKLFIGSTQMAAGVYKSSTNPAAGIAISQITGAGTLTVTAGGASSNFASWANDPLKGNIPGELPTGDFDNDGLTNLTEYALGKNPRISSQPAGVLSGNTLTFTKGTDAIANGDVSWVIETSTTLAAASWTPQVTQPAGNSAATISYTLTPRTPAANFARLKITKN